MKIRLDMLLGPFKVKTGRKESWPYSDIKLENLVEI